MVVGEVVGTHAVATGRDDTVVTAAAEVDAGEAGRARREEAVDGNRTELAATPSDRIIRP